MSRLPSAFSLVSAPDSPERGADEALRRDTGVIYLHTTELHVIVHAIVYGTSREAPLGPARSRIKLYTLSTCSHCNRAKRFFKDCGIDVEFTDVDLLSGSERAAILEEVRKLNPDCSFPTICVGDVIIVGFNEEKLREALGLP